MRQYQRDGAFGTGLQLRIDVAVEVGDHYIRLHARAEQAEDSGTGADDANGWSHTFIVYTTTKGKKYI